jgi:hypothetical protein
MNVSIIPSEPRRSIVIPSEPRRFIVILGKHQRFIVIPSKHQRFIVIPSERQRVEGPALPRRNRPRLRRSGRAVVLVSE